MKTTWSIIVYNELPKFSLKMAIKFCRWLDLHGSIATHANLMYNVCMHDCTMHMHNTMPVLQWILFTMCACSLTCFSQNFDLEIHFPVIFTIFGISNMRNCFVSDSDMYIYAMGVLVSFTVFVKFVRNAVGIPWWSLNIADSIDTCIIHMGCAVWDRRSILWSEARKTITKLAWSVAIGWIKYRKLRNAWADNMHAKYR